MENIKKILEDNNINIAKLSDKEMTEIIEALTEDLKNEDKPEIVEDKQKILNIYEAYTAYGGGCLALNQLEIPYNLIGISEILKPNIKFYNQNHNKPKNYGNIIKIQTKEVADFDILIACLEIKNIDRRKLKEEIANHIVGGRFIGIIKLLKAKNPNYVIIETDEQVISTRHSELFYYIINELQKLNYNVIYGLISGVNYNGIKNDNKLYFIAIKKELNKEYIFPNVFNPVKSIDDLLNPERINAQITIKDIKNNDILPINRWLDNMNETQRKYIYYDNRTSNIIALNINECFKLKGVIRDDIKMEHINKNEIMRMLNKGIDTNNLLKILKDLLKP